MSFITNLGNAVIGTTKTVAYTAKKHSPEILVGAGIALGVGATVAACKATTHLEETVDDIHEVFDDVREAHDSGECTDGEHAKNLLRAYAYGAKEIGKLYWMPFLLGGASVASILGGFNIIRTRHIKLIAAYSSLEKSYKSLYSRVEKEFSPEAVDKFANDLYAEEIEDEKGKKKTVDVQKGGEMGQYEWIFGPDSPGFYDNPAYNESWIVAQCRNANNRLILKKDKILTIAEVLTEMGELHIPQRFYVLGWKLPLDYYKTTAAPYIDWDISPVYKDFGEGLVQCWKINFKADGYVWGDIPEDISAVI